MNKPCDFEKKHPKCGKCQLRGVEIDYILISSSMGSSAEGQPFAPENGAHHNAVVKYEADNCVFIYTSEGIPVQLSDGGAAGSVLSVNGKTGHVVLTTSDLQNDSDYQTGSQVIVAIEDALSQLELPTKVSELENDRDYQTGAQVSAAVAAEAAARQSADTSLGDRITAVSSALSSETAARQQADLALRNDIAATQTSIANEATARQSADEALGTRISANSTAIANETTARQTADNSLQSQIDAISASSDVTDIVGTYAQLQAYDTSTLGNNDIIKVLQDESQNGETTYYRWSTTTQSFTLIGEEGPYYTKGEADGRFVAQTTYTTDKAALEAAIATKQDELTAGSGINLSGDAISVDTTVVATQSDLATKQNKLTAGQNITIDENGVISASGASASVSNHTLFV